MIGPALETRQSHTIECGVSKIDPKGHMHEREQNPIRNLSKGQRCGSLKFIGGPTITIEGHPRLSNYYESFPIQEMTLSRYWPIVGYVNDFRH